MSALDGPSVGVGYLLGIVSAVITLVAAWLLTDRRP